MCNFFEVWKISGDKQENIIVTTPANKELITIDILGFSLPFLCKFKIFLKITHSPITAGIHKSLFDLIWLYFLCIPKEVNYIFVHFIIDKPNTKPTYYIKIYRPILKTFKLVVKSLGIIILFAEYIP